jgi:hypothetical protein
MSMMGVQLTDLKKGYLLYTTNLPEVLKDALPQKDEINISFESPTPDGYIYIGRNHPFVEQLCQLQLANAFSNNENTFKLARTAVIRSDSVTEKTTIILFRVRNVIEDQRKAHQLIAEEMLVWGYRGTASDKNFISAEKAKKLLSETVPTGSLSNEQRSFILKNELNNLSNIQDGFNSIAENRAIKLVEAHERFRKVIGGYKYQVVHPVLPMDVMGIYVILPE